MRNAIATLWAVCLLGGAFLSTGCANDPSKRITALEEQNQTLTAEAERLRTENTGLQRERDLCRTDLAAAQQNLRKLAQEPDEGSRVLKPGGLVARLTVLEGGSMPDPFPPGRINLKPASQAALDRLAAEIKAKYAGRDIYVFGHTDSDTIKRSSWADNRELSAQRALAVVRYLESQGVDAKHLVACGWGDQRPLASGSSSEAKAKNRRVELCVDDSSARP